MKQKILSQLKKYLITFGIMAVISVAILAFLGFFGPGQSIYAKYSSLADAFTVPGAVALLFGLLIWVSTKGIFDPLAFGIKLALSAFTPFKRGERFEKYYDYKARKDEKRVSGYGFLVICGAIYLLIGVVFTLLFLSI